MKSNTKPVKSCKSIDQSDYRRLKMHEIQRPAGGFVAWKMCENTHTMDAPGCAGEASM